MNQSIVYTLFRDLNIHELCLFDAIKIRFCSVTLTDLVSAHILTPLEVRQEDKYVVQALACV